MRDPRHPAWPNLGERTELREVAERWKWSYLDWVNAEHRERTLGQRADRSLDDAIEEYLAHRERLVEPATLRNTRGALRQLQADFRGSVYRVDPQRTIDRLLKQSAVSTVATHSAFLSGFFSWLGLPYEVKLPKVQKTPARSWTDTEIVSIRDAAREVGILTAVDVGLFMGLRQGEIFGLEWSDIDPSTRTVRVMRQYPDRPLKGKRARTALILPGWEHDPGQGRVVAQRSSSAQRRAFTSVLRIAGLTHPGVRWHSLRHTYARLFLEAKPDLRLLQSSLGHASVRQTEETYDHLLPDRAAQMARRAIYGY